MTVPSTWKPDLPRTVAETLPAMPPAARDRLDAMVKAMKEEAPGQYSISRAVAPTDDERRGLSQRRRDLQQAMELGCRTAIEDRLHGFAFGFGTLRALDRETFAATLKVMVQAVDHLPYEAVSRACLAWTKGQIRWANCRFPPDAPELARAAEEALGQMRMEERELRIVLGAKLLPAPPPKPTQEERDRAAADATALIASIAEAGRRLDEDLSAAAHRGSNAEHLEHVRRFQAAETERKARIAEMRQRAASTAGDEAAPVRTNPAA
ncbi:hypothetical protein [Methylorubrum extorquens]